MGGGPGRDRPVRGIVVVALTALVGWLLGWSTRDPSGGLPMGIALGTAAAVAVFGPEQPCRWRRRSRR
ncbi:MAG: hypothetical protein ACRDP6_01845 [Actinoallomurus sp.]